MFPFAYVTAPARNAVALPRKPTCLWNISPRSMGKSSRALVEFLKWVYSYIYCSLYSWILTHFHALLLDMYNLPLSGNQHCRPVLRRRSVPFSWPINWPAVMPSWWVDQLRRLRLSIKCWSVAIFCFRNNYDQLFVAFFASKLVIMLLMCCYFCESFYGLFFWEWFCDWITTNNTDDVYQLTTS